MRRSDLVHLAAANALPRIWERVREAGGNGPGQTRVEAAAEEAASLARALADELDDTPGAPWDPEPEPEPLDPSA